MHNIPPSIRINPLFKKAYDIAVKVHEKDKDANGIPYTEHVFGVAEITYRKLAGNIPQEQCLPYVITALLHDVIEDHPESEDIVKNTFSTEIYEAILSVTKKEIEKGHYHYIFFIKRAKQNPIGKIVKIADLEHNMDRDRYPKIIDPKYYLKRYRKYLSAWLFLNDHIDYEQYSKL